MRIYLPRDAGSDNVPGAVEPAALAEPDSNAAASRTRTVLVVDDEEVIRRLAAEALRDDGYAVLEAADGEAALRILRSGKRIDLLVTDVGLPGLNGRQLAEAARESRPGLPVLMITGYAGAMPIDLVLPAGMQVLAKPFALEALTDSVSALLAADGG